jgi:hypothetical protein
MKGKAKFSGNQFSVLNKSYISPSDFMSDIASDMLHETN